MAETELRKEKEGIFAWMVEGASLYLKDGKLLNPSQIMREAIEDYKYQSDNLSQFIADCLVKEKDAQVGFEETFRAYEAWCRDTGRDEDDRSPKKYFGQNMKERDIRNKRTKRGMVFLDCRLKLVHL